MDFFNDATYKCTDCNRIFKVFYDDDCITNFCPNCASRNLEDFEYEENEI